MRFKTLFGVGLVVLSSSTILRADSPPPCDPYGSEAYELKVEVSLDGGSTWHSDSMTLTGYGQEQIHVACEPS